MCGLKEFLRVQGTFFKKVPANPLSYLGKIKFNTFLIYLSSVSLRSTPSPQGEGFKTLPTGLRLPPSLSGTAFELAFSSINLYFALYFLIYVKTSSNLKKSDCLTNPVF